MWKDLPAASHYRADIAAIYSRHAYRNLGNEGFWTVHDALFALSPDFSDPTLKDLSKQLLLKWQFVEASIELQKDGDKLYESMSLARSLQVEDAPALFINGRRIDGKIEQEALEELVIEERDYASKLIDARGSRDGLYEEMCKTQSSSSPGAGGVARSGNSSPK